MAIFFDEGKKESELVFSNLSGISFWYVGRAHGAAGTSAHPCRPLQSDQTRLIPAECIPTRIWGFLL